MAAASIALALGRSTLAQPLPCSYSVTVLPEVNCGAWAAPGNVRAINNLGEVLLTGACGDYDRMYLWTGGSTLQILLLAPGMLGFAGTDLSDVGLVVGTAVTTTAGQRGFVYNRNTGAWTELPPLSGGGGWSGANAVTNDGLVAGFRSLTAHVNPQTAFIWSERDGFTDLGLINDQSTAAVAINENGVCTGTLVSRGVKVPFIWDGKTLDVLPSLAGLETVPRAISDDNRVVGRGHISYPGAPGGVINHAFHWHAGVMTAIPPLPGFVNSSAQHVSSSGTVLGFSRLLTGGGDRAFAWEAGNLVVLTDLVDPAANLIMTFAGATANDGCLLGFGQLSGMNVAVVLWPQDVTADTDHNCRVDVDDLICVILEWGSTDSPADVTHDGIVDVFDLILVIQSWSP